MTSDECFQSETTTFKFKESWPLGDFSTLIQGKRHILKQKINNCQSDKYTFYLLFCPVEYDDTSETFSNIVSLYLVVTFPLNVNHFQYTVFVDGQFSFIRQNKSSQKYRKTGE